MPAGGRRGMIHARAHAGRSPGADRGLGRETTTASRAPEPPVGSERARRSIARRASWRGARGPAGGERENAQPFELQGRARPSAAPELDAVPRHQFPSDPRKRLRGFEGDRVETRSLRIDDAELDMTASQRPGKFGDAADDSSGAVRKQFLGGPPYEVVAGPLVRSIEDPSVDRLGTYSGPCGDRGSPVPSSKTEEDRAGSVGRDEKSSRARVEAQKEVRMLSSRGAHRARVDPPSGPFASDRPVRDELPRGPPARPRDRRARAHDASSLPFRVHHRADRGEVPAGLLDRDDLADRAVVP